MLIGFTFTPVPWREWPLLDGSLLVFLIIAFPPATGRTHDRTARMSHIASFEEEFSSIDLMKIFRHCEVTGAPSRLAFTGRPKHA
jgi:hypothetical protein